MRNFRQYLTEATKKAGFAPWHQRDPAQVYNILYYNHRNMGKWNITNSGFRINKSGSVSYGPSSVDNYTLVGLGDIPDGYGFLFKYSTLDVRGCNISSDKITNLWGAPDVVKGNLGVFSKSLPTLDHLIVDVKEYFQFKCENVSDWGDSWVTCKYMKLYETGSLTFRDIAKHFQPSQHLLIHPLVIDKLPEKGLLGLTRLKPAGQLGYLPIGIIGDTAGSHSFYTQIIKLVQNNFELLDAKEALMTAGYKEYAKL